MRTSYSPQFTAQKSTPRSLEPLLRMYRIHIFLGRIRDIETVQRCEFCEVIEEVT